MSAPTSTSTFTFEQFATGATIEAFDAGTARSAALGAVRASLDAIRSTTSQWPTDVSSLARQTTVEIAKAIDEAVSGSPAPASAGSGRDVVGDRSNRRAMRMAMCHALELVTICDAARAHGLCGPELLRAATRTLAMVALVYHSASSAAAE